LPYSPRAPSDNHLLASLPPAERARMIEHCETVHLDLSACLCVPGERIEHIYFPLRHCFISVIAAVDGKNRLEVGMIGNEGMLGIPLALGESNSPLLAQVQGSGPALRMSAGQFGPCLNQSPALQRCLRRYIHVLMTQLAQSVACVRFHFVEARLARWLLMSHDRAHADEFHVTQLFLSHMLGVRRVGITNAAGSLQDKKLIRYHRGQLLIVDRSGLEAAACSCYRIDRDTYRTVMGRSVPPPPN